MGDKVSVYLDIVGGHTETCRPSDLAGVIRSAEIFRPQPPFLMTSLVFQISVIRSI